MSPGSSPEASRGEMDRWALGGSACPAQAQARDGKVEVRSGGFRSARRFGRLCSEPNILPIAGMSCMTIRSQTDDDEAVFVATFRRRLWACRSSA